MESIVVYVTLSEFGGLCKHPACTKSKTSKSVSLHNVELNTIDYTEDEAHWGFRQCFAVLVHLQCL